MKQNNNCNEVINTIFSPIALLAYNRKEHVEKTINALLACPEAKDTDVYVFADGAKDIQNIAKTQAVRDYVKTVRGFRSLKVIERKTNYGLAINVVDGITRVLEDHETVIVVEDDIIAEPCFLTFMNKALHVYEQQKEIFQINARLPFNIETKENKVLFSPMAGCWGWATWRDRWALYERNVEQAYEDLRDLDLRKRINIGNLINIASQLDDNYNGKLSWEGYLNYTSCKYHKSNVYPPKSIVYNIGQDGTGIHEVESYVSNSFNIDINTIAFNCNSDGDDLYAKLENLLSRKNISHIENYNKNIYTNKMYIQRKIFHLVRKILGEKIYTYIRNIIKK